LITDAIVFVVKTETLSTIEDVRESAHAWAKYLIYPRNECYL